VADLPPRYHALITSAHTSKAAGLPIAARCQGTAYELPHVAGHQYLSASVVHPTAVFGHPWGR